MRLLPYGEQAVLVEAEEDEQPLTFAAALAAAAAPAIAEIVPAARTVLVRFAPGQERPDIATLLRHPSGTGGHFHETARRAPVELPVRYTGADLHQLAEEVGMSAGELIERHANARYTVAFCGFAPGFAYLTGLDRALWAPRLAEPRTAVPAGSVGIAGEYTGVYPRSSPGGWRLIGRTDATLWDTHADPPATLSPGRTVRFVPT
jgi:KipI family sensor histidine kinase inhibitor